MICNKCNNDLPLDMMVANSSYKGGYRPLCRDCRNKDLRAKRDPFFKGNSKEPWKSLEQRFEERYIPEPNSGCWIWVGATNRGYGVIKKDGIVHRATHLSLNFYQGLTVPQGMVACHKCDNTHCVNPKHLFLGTPKDNSQDMVKKGRQRGHTGRREDMAGEKNPSSKLSRSDVQKIRELGLKKSQVVERYGISSSQAYRIVTGQSWKEV